MGEIVVKRAPPISKSAYARICAIVNADRDYSPATAEALAPAYHGVGVPIDAVWSIRNVLIKQKIVSGHIRVRQSVGKIVAEYGRGGDICSMAITWDYPPLYLLRTIFTSMGQYRQNEISALFSESDPPIDILSPADRDAYTRARSCDSDRAAHDVAAEAQMREDEFVKLFAGYPHKTQDDLVQEQISAYGRAMTTPDILFTPRPLTIISGTDTTYVNWIDYKSFVGVPGTFLTAKIRQQVSKYTAEYGPGAIVFRGGYVTGMEQALGVRCYTESDFI